MALPEDLGRMLHIPAVAMCQSINKCAVLPPLGSPFTAVSAHTVSEMYHKENGLLS